MPTFVALLRGVNVAGAKRVPMGDLRRLLCGLGYTSVVTLLNSGNAVFRTAGGTSAKHAANIAAAVLSELGVDVPVVVKSAREMARIVSENPIRAEPAEHSRLLVAFAQDAKALGGLASLEQLLVPGEQFALGRSAAYLLCANGILESKAGVALLGKIGKPATSRNWATTLKLQALASSSHANIPLQPAETERSTP